MSTQDTAEKAQVQKRAPRGQGMCKEERRFGKVVGWVATLPIPGERPITFRAQTQKEVLAKREDFKVRVARGEVSLVAGRVKRRAAEKAIVAPVVTVTVTDFVNYWLNNHVKPDYTRPTSDDPEAKREAGRQPTTYSNYRWEMDKYVLPIIGGTRFDRLDEDVIEKLWQTMKASGVPYTMRYKVLVELRTAINYTLRLRPKSTMLRWNPAASKLATLAKPKSPEKPAVDYGLLGRIMDAVRGQDRLDLVINIGLRTGLRRGNICGLRFGDFEGGMLTVQRRVNRIKGLGIVTRGGLKGKQDDDAVSYKQYDPSVFEPLLAEQRKRNIERYLQSRSHWRGPDPRSPEAPLFPSRYGTPVDPQEILRGVKALVTAQGAPHYTIHQMRHDFVNQARDSGLDLLTVSKLVDHSTTAVTQMVYTHFAQEQLGTSFLGVSSQLDARTRTAQEKAV